MMSDHDHPDTDLTDPHGEAEMMRAERDAAVARAEQAEARVAELEAEVEELLAWVDDLEADVDRLRQERNDLAISQHLTTLAVRNVTYHAEGYSAGWMAAIEAAR